MEESIENRGLLKRVFRLKYLENVTNGLELSEKLGLSFAETVKLEQILDAYLLKRINVINAERLELVCPECLEARIWPDPESGERACTNCGFVVNEPADNELCEQDDSLPFDTPYGRPTSDLSVGRSLGDTLDAKSQGLILEDNCHVKSVDFGYQYGIWIYDNNSNWQNLHPISTYFIATGDMNGNGKDEIIVDFGPQYGIWIYHDDGTWSQLHDLSSLRP